MSDITDVTFQNWKEILTVKWAVIWYNVT